MIFSIVIPTYNNEETIKNAIDSCINQEFDRDFEILIVNNASTDGTKAILELYSSEEKIRVVNNPITVSLWENHNVCLKEAGGDYVVFCHSDDELFSQALAILYQRIEFRNYPQKYVIWGRSLFSDFYHNWEKGGVGLNEVLSGVYSQRPFYYGGLTPSGTCYSRESFLNLGGFIECTQNIGPSDLVTMLKLSINGFEFEMIDRLLVKREVASTAFYKSFYEDKIIPWGDALKFLEDEIGSKKFLEVVDFSFQLKPSPFNFHLGLLNIGVRRKKVLKITILKLLRHPGILWKILRKKKFRSIVRLGKKFIRGNGRTE